MRLSIFNFKPIRLTIFFLVLLVAIAGWFKMRVLQQAPRGLRPLSDGFWLAKTHTNKKFDVVVIGDSRVYRDIAPSVMQQNLHGWAVFNFGYSSAGMSHILLKAGEAKLNSAGGRVIVLGITPYSLTNSAALNEHYKEYQKAMLWPYQIPFLSILLSPNETSWAITNLLGFKMKEYYQIPHSDGWVESDQVPENINSAMSEYEQRFTKEKVSNHVLKEMLDQVHVWKSQGITVFGFRPPASEKMELLENTRSGYDEALIKKQFMDAGGIWIDIKNRSMYKTYDGSHLNSRSARILSTNISHFISGAMTVQPSNLKK